MPWYLILIKLTLYTGMRISEIRNLKWSDIGDLSIRVNSKGKEKYIPLSQKAKTLIRSIERSSEYVFPNKGGNPFRSDYLSKKFKEFIRKAKLNDNYSFHTLRHSFASHLVMNAVSIYKVSKLLGHSSVTTTQIYAHLSPESLEDVMDKLGY